MSNRVLRRVSVSCVTHGRGTVASGRLTLAGWVVLASDEQAHVDHDAVGVVCRSQLHSCSCVAKAQVHPVNVQIHEENLMASVHWRPCRVLRSGWRFNSQLLYTQRVLRSLN